MHGQMQKLRRWLCRDGWLLLALAAAVALCLLSGAGSASTGMMTDTEARAARILSAIEGAGSVEVAIFYAEEDEAAVPCGAVLVAEGADDVAVRLRLSQAVSTLFGLDNDKIDIFKRREGP